MSRSIFLWFPLVYLALGIVLKDKQGFRMKFSVSTRFRHGLRKLYICEKGPFRHGVSGSSRRPERKSFFSYLDTSQPSDS